MKTYQFYHMRKVIILSACFLGAFAIQSCKDDGVLQPDFVNETANSMFTDQQRIEAQVKRVDSILTDETATGLVGLFQDSVFGISKAGFYVQPLLSSNFQVYFESGETYTTDSVILSFPYNGIYGSLSQTTVEVYRLSEDLIKDAVYYSDDSVATENAILGTKTFSPNLSDNLQIASPNLAGSYDTLLLPPQLRIPLDNSLGDEILSKSGGPEVQNNTNFASFLKGLKVQVPDNLTSSNNQISILSLALTNTQSKLSVFYTTISGSGDTSKRVVDFPINTNSVRFNQYEHDYSNSAIQANLDDGQIDSTFIYASGMGGVQTEIVFPVLYDQFKERSIVVNRAELVLPFRGGSYATSGAADELILASLNNSGNLEFLTDFFEGEDYFGGRYDAARNAYVFNINRYIQKLINGDANSKALVLLVEGSATTAERVVISGPAQSDEKIRLNLYYSNTLD